MSAIRRRIDGPQNQHEQRDGIVYRDTRRVGQQLAEMLTTGFSAVPLAALAGLCLVVPALCPVIAVIAGSYAMVVMTRPTQLPLRLPASVGGKDPFNIVPDPKRDGGEILGPAAGDWLLGWDEATGQQLWLAGKDMTLHGLLPGATGAGKTQTIYSLLCNALAAGSGFTLIDGKASNNLAFSVQTMARRFGREADVRVINLLVSSGDKKTNTWNPFATVSAEGMTELLKTLFLPDEAAGGDGSNQYFQSKADSLFAGMAFIFVWVRDCPGLRIPITSETIRVTFSDIEKLRALAEDRIFHYYDFTSQSECFEVLPEDFPDVLLNPIRYYVKETGGFKKGQSVDDQAKVREQHSYVVGGFAKTFTQMGSTLGHVFRCSIPDVDLRDVLYNRRILVVMLPSLENHPETNAALGKAVITALRYALAAALGTSVEGDYEDVVVNRPSASDTPYPMIMDEFGYFATRGMDTMMAQGRELNVSLWLSFQEIGTIYATLGRDRSVPLLGNPELRIFQNIRDPGPTKEWVEQTGGTMNVSMLPGYDNSSPIGLYADQERADIREVKRISWNDISSLRPGQAIMLWRGQRIYMRLFYAGIEPKGQNRVFPTIAPSFQKIGEDTAPKVRTLDDVTRQLAAGRHYILEDQLEALPGVLGKVMERLPLVLGTIATPMQDAVILLRDLATEQANKEPARPFAELFHNRPTPALLQPPKGQPLSNVEDQALLEILCEADMALGEEDPKDRIVAMLNARRTSQAG
ncbi:MULTISPECIES: type IV secretory system conjugative DNA transfer family protein [Asaia]|uniref:Type IV secretion system DNA-binding domain-containing protein n=1 Tax=Asaia spathodeae TaxID=657016 RepID=A0ABX2P832_9PROT|nr:TraM recognition domain-containing protein [Asaia spathodeae]GBR20189.1 DotL protein [Asaia spathodeae NBRC 105894]